MPVETTAARIPAASRRQALDWSLVLLSQGIESTILPPDIAGDWALELAAEQESNALAAIQQYQFENRRWPWRREILQPGLLFDWGSLAWVALIVMFYTLMSGRPDLRAAGIMDSQLVFGGQWWRLWTAAWLHADLAHLAGNAAIGLVLLGLAMARFGTGVGLLAAYVAGATGNAIACLLSAPHRSLGASGVVMGALGLLTIQSLWSWRTSGQAAKHFATGVMAGALLFILLGLSPGTDVLAHAGGFLGGFLIGAVLTFLPDAQRMPKLNLLCGLAFAALVVWPWWLAIRTL